VKTLRRVLILADESAEWMVAGLRQLERLALSIDEFAVENKETAPVLVCIIWRPDLDQAQRWVPTHERLTMVAFTTDRGEEPFDLVLNTRLFLYRKAVRVLFSEGRASARPTTFAHDLFESGDAPTQVAPTGEDLWKIQFRSAELVPQNRIGVWSYITDGEQIDEIEKEFLRDSGKSQDGFVSRHLNRPISRLITRLLLRFPTTPNAWTVFIFPIPVVASLILLQGTYWSFLWGLVLFQIFSVLDGCDGELARAKFLESERGRQLDDLFDILSNILLVLGLGFGLSQPANSAGQFAWVYVIEGLVAAALIGGNEYYLATPDRGLDEGKAEPLDGALYPRHRALVQRSGILVFGERFASGLIQFTKRDVAVLFFVFLAAIGCSAWILHLLLAVTVASLALAVKASVRGRSG